MTVSARPVRGTERMRASDPNHWRRVVNCCEVDPTVCCYATDPGLVLDGPLLCPCDLADRCRFVKAEKEGS